jgi:excinuclease ABC subunit A
MNVMSQPAIILRGIRVHNLQDIDLDIQPRSLTAISGVSGAGKSSLALDTLHAEAYHRYLQILSPGLRQHLEQVQKPDADRIDNLPPAVAISQRQLPTGPRVTVGTMTEVLDYLRLLFVRLGLFHCPNCGRPVRPSTAGDVLVAAEALPAGTLFTVAFARFVQSDEAAKDQIEELRLAGFVRAQVQGQVVRLEDLAAKVVNRDQPLWVLVDRLEAAKTARERMQDSVETSFRFGQGRMAILLDDRHLLFDQRPICPHCDTNYPPLEASLLDFNDPAGACPACGGTGLAQSGRRKPRPGGLAVVCPECQGRRLSRAALSLTLGAHSLAEICSWEISELAAWCRDPRIAAAGRPEIEVLVRQINRRLQQIIRLGLGYLTLERAAVSLSAGEVLRLRLATALAADLAGVLYVLDEPATGLHPSEIGMLLQVLQELRDAGNTIVLVENNLDMLRCADCAIDLGPGAGDEGGGICYQGPPAGLVQSTTSFTARYLSDKGNIAVPRQRRATHQGHLRIVGAGVHNLRDLDLEMPLGVLCVLTGVSGAGKSTLLEQVLFAALTRPEERTKKSPAGNRSQVLGGGQLGDVVYMDRRPLPRTARSNAITYIKAFDAVREEFAATADAKIRNFDSSAFSFNQPGGRCETCQGQGVVTVDMQFLADLSVNCPECQGHRYRQEVLDIKVRGRNIAEVLDLTAREAFRFFRTHPAIQRKLKPLLDVGLDYLRLGQATETLSGGEAQRLKLAGYLAASRKPRCLFLLDEPAAGLHPADITRLLDCFDRLLQTGHSLIVVENQLDVIKCADYVIDLGPGAGKAGGKVVAAGTPEEIAAAKDSVTGSCLRAAGIPEHRVESLE